MATAEGYIFVGAGAYSTDAVTTSGNYVNMGGFREDLRIRASEERFNIEVADHLAYIKSVRTRFDVFLQTSLVESRLHSLGMVMGRTASNVQTATETGSMELLIDQPAIGSHKFIAADATEPSSAELISYTFSRCLPIADFELAYRKDSELLIPSQFMVLGTIAGGNMGLGWVAKA